MPRNRVGGVWRGFGRSDTRQANKTEKEATKLEETDLRFGGLFPRQGRYPLQLRRLRRRAEGAQSAVTHRRRRILLNRASNCVKTSKDTASSCSWACSLPYRGRRACSPSPLVAGPERLYRLSEVDTSGRTMLKHDETLDIDTIDIKSHVQR